MRQVSRCTLTVILEQEHFQSFPQHWQWNTEMFSRRRSAGRLFHTTGTWTAKLRYPVNERSMSQNATDRQTDRRTEVIESWRLDDLMNGRQVGDTKQCWDKKLDIHCITIPRRLAMRFCFRLRYVTLISAIACWHTRIPDRTALKSVTAMHTRHGPPGLPRVWSNSTMKEVKEFIHSKRWCQYQTTTTQPYVLTDCYEIRISFRYRLN